MIYQDLVVANKLLIILPSHWKLSRLAKNPASGTGCIELVGLRDKDYPMNYLKKSSSVYLARAIVNRLIVLMADEPTEPRPETSWGIMDLLVEINAVAPRY